MAGQSVEWDGSSQQGNLADQGLYLFLIEYDNGKVENGTITILE